MACLRGDSLSSQKPFREYISGLGNRDGVSAQLSRIAGCPFGTNALRPGIERLVSVSGQPMKTRCSVLLGRSWRRRCEEVVLLFRKTHSASRSTVSALGLCPSPRSRPRIVRTLKPDLSTRSSCVSQAARRCCLSNDPKAVAPAFSASRGVLGMRGFSEASRQPQSGPSPSPRPILPVILLVSCRFFLARTFTGAQNRSVTFSRRLRRVLRQLASSEGLIESFHPRSHNQGHRHGRKDEQFGDRREDTT